MTMKAAGWGVGLLLLVLLIASTPGWGDSKVTASATCSDYSNQADAQRAKDTRDTDGDGIYCESLPCPCLKPGSGGVVAEAAMSRRAAVARAHGAR